MLAGTDGNKTQVACFELVIIIKSWALSNYRYFETQ